MARPAGPALSAFSGRKAIGDSQGSNANFQPTSNDRERCTEKCSARWTRAGPARRGPLQEISHHRLLVRAAFIAAAERSLAVLRCALLRACLTSARCEAAS
jgi:hypothetical protein